MKKEIEIIEKREGEQYKEIKLLNRRRRRLYR